MNVIAEYLWLDGQETPEIRSKAKVLKVEEGKALGLEDIPVWGFDGSSTKQAEGESSDCVLQPVRVYKDPIRGGSHIIVLNEVYLPNGDVHSSNTRDELKRTAERLAAADFWFGVEQEYALLKDGRLLGFPETGFPGPQGPYYCSVGAGKAFGRQIVEKHLEDCLTMGILVDGINAEVMPGQWEYQIGPDGPLKVADDLIVARWLLERIGEDHGVTVTLDPKPVKGDWNGSGAHTNFSTAAMRERLTESDIAALMAKFERNCGLHVKAYGADNHKRLTGNHETCAIDQFRYGVSDRGASIRIPLHVHKAGKGYLEDRRPGANMDPYKVLDRIMKTVCE